jgi:predicted AAA+ superfamily ATPase
MHILIDEIQEINIWEEIINSYSSNTNYDIVITGSNSKLQLTELSTLLIGKNFPIYVYPYSF